MSLRARLLSGYFLAAAVLIVLEFFSVYTLRQLKSSFVQATEEEIQSLRTADQIGLFLQAQDDMQLRFVLTENKNYLDRFEKKKRDFTVWLQEADRSAKRAREKEIVGRIQELYKEYLKNHRDLVASVRQDIPYAKRWEKLEQSRNQLNTMLALQDQYYRFNQEQIAGLRKRVTLLAGNLESGIYFVTGILVFFGLLVSATTAFSFRRRLSLLMRAVRAVEEGKRVKLNLAGNDEIARLARAFNFMQESIKEREAKLTELSFTDSLTQAFNFRFLNRHIRNNVQADRPTCLFMLDLDHFKRVNDTQGHLVGDKVLKRVAAILRGVIRRDDFVCRYGGEEFCVVSYGLNAKEAQSLGERMRREIAEELKEYGLTVSVGFACAPQDATDLNWLLRIADERLYRAKELGRNCVLGLQQA